MTKIEEIDECFGVIGLKIKYFIDIFDTIFENKDLLQKISVDKTDAFQHKINSLGGAMIATVGEMIIITCLSWLDEYENELTPKKIPELSDRIFKYKAITKPIIRRIKQWSGMRDLRNMILVHNLRDKGISLFNSELQERELKVPIDPSEIKLLTELVHYACFLFFDEFKDYNVESHRYLFDKIKMRSEIVNISSEMNSILTEVAIRKIQYIDMN